MNQKTNHQFINFDETFYSISYLLLNYSNYLSDTDLACLFGQYTSIEIVVIRLIEFILNFPFVTFIGTIGTIRNAKYIKMH